MLAQTDLLFTNYNIGNDLNDKDDNDCESVLCSPCRSPSSSSPLSPPTAGDQHNMIIIFIAIIKKKSFSPELESLQAVAAQVDCVARCDLPGW